MKKIPLIDLMTNKKYPLKTGGIIILFEDLIIQCKRMDIDYKIIKRNIKMEDYV